MASLIKENGDTSVYKKFFLLAVAATLVNACTPLHPTGCHKTYALGECSSVRWTDHDEWADQARAIRTAINAKLDDAGAWKGKQCWLHIKFTPDAKAIKITTSDGYQPYCKALKAAATEAKYPAFSDPKLFHDFQNTHLDMRG